MVGERDIKTTGVGGLNGAEIDGEESEICCIFSTAVESSRASVKAENLLALEGDATGNMEEDRIELVEVARGAV